MIYEITSWNTSMTEMASFNTLDRMIEYLKDLSVFKTRRVRLRVLIDTGNKFEDVRNSELNSWESHMGGPQDTLD